MNGYLNLVEFFAIRRNLDAFSDTWADLWAMLYLSQVGPGQLLGIKFKDIRDGRLVLPATKGRKKICILLKAGVKNIILSRMEKYPGDIFLFQSHTNRTKASPRPVTLVAFNMALKKASLGVTKKIVSSKSAFHLTLGS